MPTTNLGLALLTAGQNQKEVTINSDFSALDTVLAAFAAANAGKLVVVGATSSTAIGVSSPLQVSGGNLSLNTPGLATKYLDGTGSWSTPAGSGGGTVNSVGLSLPSIFSVSGSPVTATGTLTATLASQSANLVLAGPASGSAATPAFRSLVALDLPAVTTSAQGAAPQLSGVSTQFLNGNGAWSVPPGTGGSGTVTSVAMTVPSFLSLSGSPITVSGTLALTLATQSANTFLRGPNTGAAATPTFGALVALDLPAVTTSAQGACPTLPNVATQFLNGTGAWSVPSFVSSVAMSVPGFLSVSGSPITSSGTLAVTAPSQNANLVLAGPSSGSAATPAFRALSSADIPKAPVVYALTDAATIATDASLGNHFRVTLGGNRTLGAPTNPTDGQRCVWELIQDATGSRTITLNAIFALGTDIATVTLSTAANKRDFLGAVYNSTAAKWYVIAFVRGY